MQEIRITTMTSAAIILDSNMAHSLVGIYQYSLDALINCKISHKIDCRKAASKK